jgi:hypothetical protein
LQKRHNQAYPFFVANFLRTSYLSPCTSSHPYHVPITSPYHLSIHLPYSTPFLNYFRFISSIK